jgi:outer membrane protein, heavy metal efflux system
MRFPVLCQRAAALPARLLCVTVAAAGMAASFPAAASPPGLSLYEAVRLATARAPLLDARRAELSAAREEAARAGALPDPMLMAGIDNLPVTGADAFDDRVDMMTMKRLGLRQELPARAKRAARRTLAERRIDDALAAFEAERLSLRRAAAEAWIGAWTAQRELASLQSLRAQGALAADLARARMAGGAESVAAALATRSWLLELDNRIEAARATQAVAEAELQRWVGAGGGAAGSAPDFDTLPVPRERLLASLESSGPLLRAAAEVETAAAAIDLARAERRPDWSIAAAYGRREAGRADMLMLEVGVGLPLFPGRRQDRGIAARQAEYQASLAAREDLRLQAAARLRADLARWEGLNRQVALDRRALLPLARDRSATALTAYRGGGALQPWLEARRDELELQLAHVARLGELGRAWAALAFLLPGEDRP